MERSEIRGCITARDPDCASLHPGYICYFMRFASRTFLILFAYASACAAAAVVLIGGGLLFEYSWQDLSKPGVLGVVSLAAMLMTMIGAALPAIVAIVYAESFSVQSLKYYATCGSSAGLLALLFFVPALHQVRQFFDFRSMLMFAVITAAGLAGGLCYWAIAGRTAGTWETRS
jgi:hypothetical protein